MMAAAHDEIERGQSLVEFALISTLLFTIIFGIFEFGRAFYAYSAVVNAASEGARFGIIDPNNTACIKNVAVSHMVALNVLTNTVSVACPSGCTFGQPISVTVVYTFTAVTPYVPSFQMAGSSSMNIMHVPSSLGTCP